MIRCTHLASEEASNACDEEELPCPGFESLSVHLVDDVQGTLVLGGGRTSSSDCRLLLIFVEINFARFMARNTLYCGRTRLTWALFVLIVNIYVKSLSEKI